MTTEEAKAKCKFEAEIWLSIQVLRVEKLARQKICEHCLKKTYGENCGGEIVAGACLQKTSRHSL